MSWKIFKDPSEDDMDEGYDDYPECAICGEKIKGEYLWRLPQGLVCEDCLDDMKEPVDSYVSSTRYQRWRWNHAE